MRGGDWRARGLEELWKALWKQRAVIAEADDTSQASACLHFASLPCLASPARTPASQSPQRRSRRRWLDCQVVKHAGAALLVASTLPYLVAASRAPRCSACTPARPTLLLSRLSVLPYCRRCLLLKGRRGVERVQY